MGLVGLPAAVFFPLGDFFMSIPAVGAGWRVLRALQEDSAARSMLSWHFGPVLISSILGVVLGGIGVVLMALHFISLVHR